MGKILAVRYLIIGGTLLFLAGMAISNPHTHPIWATTMVCLGTVAIIVGLVLGTTLGAPKTDEGENHENPSDCG